MLEGENYLVPTSELFQNEHIQVEKNWQENVVTSLPDPTAVGISNINEWEGFLNVPITSSSVPGLHFKLLLKTFKMHKYLSIDVWMRLQQTLMTIITQTAVMMSGAK